MWVEIEPARVVSRLRLAVYGVLAASLAAWFVRHVLGFRQAQGLVPLLDVNREANVPTWFSSLLLALAGGLSLLVAGGARRGGDRRWQGWSGVAVVLGALSLDETAQIHEHVAAWVRFAAGPLDGPLRFAWVIPGLAFVAGLGLASGRFLRSLDPGVRRGLVRAGAIYFGGAIGLEMVGGWWVSRWGEEGPFYGLLTHVEEAAEMLGAVGFAGAALAVLASQRAMVAVVGPREAAGPAGTGSPELPRPAYQSENTR